MKCPCSLLSPCHFCFSISLKHEPSRCSVDSRYLKNVSNFQKFYAYILVSIGVHLTEALFRPPFLLPSPNNFNKIENGRTEIEYPPDSEDTMHLSHPWFSDSSEEIDDDLLNPPDKKSQTLCRVRKIRKSHYEDGFEFHPKQYNEYECVPYEGDLTEGSVHNLVSSSWETTHGGFVHLSDDDVIVTESQC
nr:unnamed protein product [Callosobruchus analis]